ncbi:MAG: cell division protein FtsH [Candidatus Komeilibacteria bacterium CG11_big_fil_rev_8_21_14_0_20_36_20]|uniref:ATP-dependent zinc metalloprotease FtsH n=1 Tax=Candidatus Komeilibacteria bacterium CG11_big_fil_rev_8_21_14_0_20_36_20 TaxID=1974477 RepID=A0A2H0ND63_9BACT|nr:MAG: cell division protein FtsH [Candidatus Komeilibacteria bacterium CG11_big_fil_rev_8_21_14_0_20_36_20]PIR81830.1 MAG: cell division protein FtsH [Candidatus Komeilibacteria bacterium CG10_big_fil_rev_8_21_14_0_10_36_65]PJC55320.1 MAG: cell division protein FtsH [Candidatus Komeilibacteria bacterium CG_4_9_14_0_2_um_filter_36_13]
MKHIIKNFLIFFIIFAIIAGIFSFYDTQTKKTEEISISNLVQQINNGEVENVIVAGNELKITLKNQEQRSSQKEGNESFAALLKNYEVPEEKISALNITVEDAPNSGMFVGTILPFLIPLLFIVGLIWFMMRQVQGVNNRAMTFGQSGAKIADRQKDKITFQDVAGAHEAKEDLEEIVKFLQEPQKFTAMGAKIPRGVLLLGAPGTGKTLLARAVAGEAKVPFFHISGSEFVEMFVGVGASRVRDLFKKAKKTAPCLIFVDEIDAVGRQRGTGLGGSHDEREQTLNQILVEMDGFDNQTNVIVIAATNRPDVLDPALLRPGRFDRQVVIDLPDIKDREAILKIHAKKKPLATNVNLKLVAQRTPGFSGADLANVLNEAAIMTVKNNEKNIHNETILDAIERVMLGRERKSYILSDKEKGITAHHEAGHALIAHILPHADPVHKISIISRGRAAGYTINLPDIEKKMQSYSDFIDSMAVLLGGYAAEKIFFDEVTTGASNDLKKVTHTARQIVTQFGMDNKLGPRTFGEREEMIFLGKEIHERRDYSEKTAEMIDQEISKYIDQALKTATKIINENKDKIAKIVKVLLNKETIEKEEFAQLIA